MLGQFLESDIFLYLNPHLGWNLTASGCAFGTLQVVVNALAVPKLSDCQRKEY